MPKLKTHKGASARFKISGTGKLLRMKGHRSHLRRKKTNKVNPLWQWPGKKKSLELEEWWFEDCPRDELHHCYTYELGRHIHEVVWRHLEDKRNKFKLEGKDIRVNGVWSYCLRLYSNSNQG